MGAVAEGQNYQDYMISHRWEHEVEQPQVSSTNFAETFAAETEPTIGERISAVYGSFQHGFFSTPFGGCRIGWSLFPSKRISF